VKGIGSVHRDGICWRRGVVALKASEASSVGEEDGRPQMEEIFDEEPDSGVAVPGAEEVKPNQELSLAVQEPAHDAQSDKGSQHSENSHSSAEDLTDVHMRVSSKHLILASPVFRRMLGPTFEEGQGLRTEGSTDIALGDDDPDAFYILMNIIHSITRKVPRCVTLDMLAKLAVLVNYYQMHEAVEPFSDSWITNLVQEGLPDCFCADAIR